MSGWRIGYNQGEYTPLQLVFPNLNATAGGVVSDDEAEGFSLIVGIAHEEIFEGCMP